jgi:hypothetical protein
MGYKGIRKLNNAVSAILAPFGISKARYDDENGYTYYPTNHKVTFKILEEYVGDDLFIEFVKDTFDFTIPNSFIISLLHEVGHHYTLDTIDEETLNFCYDEKQRISEELNTAETYEDIKALFYQYFMLPDELEATTWAVDYAEAHPRKIKIMWNKVRETIFEFCENNDIFSED